ncbi:MAG: hypothetical protein WC533_01565 [Candidatus Pacearchaeota archaeon]
MIKQIDMKLMRNLNLFAKVTKVSPNHCFIYNATIIFVVPKNKLYQAIGEESRNLKKMSDIIGKKTRVVSVPEGLKDAESFISTIVHPIELNSVEVQGNMLIINATSQNKAMLIGRNKTRLEEMKKIIKSYFGKELKIV